MYRVVKLFYDLQDNDHAYAVGDEFPRKGLVVTAARIAELASNQNKMGCTLIEEVKEAPKKKKAVKKTAEK